MGQQRRVAAEEPSCIQSISRLVFGEPASVAPTRDPESSAWFYVPMWILGIITALLVVDWNDRPLINRALAVAGINAECPDPAAADSNLVILTIHTDADGRALPDQTQCIRIVDKQSMRLHSVTEAAAE